MLDLNEMTNLEEAKRNIQDKAVILNAAIDIQALLRLLVEKEVIGKEEINSQRQEVRESFKYRNAITYIEQTMKEIEFYEKNPDTRLREMFRRKMEGKRTPQENKAYPVRSKARSFRSSPSFPTWTLWEPIHRNEIWSRNSAARTERIFKSHDGSRTLYLCLLYSQRCNRNHRNLLKSQMG